MNEEAAWVSFMFLSLCMVIYGTMCSYTTLKYHSEVKKYEKRTVEIESGQEIIINNYESCWRAEIKAHYTEGNETREITLVSSPPPYNGISCAVSAEELNPRMKKLMEIGRHVAKISPYDENTGYAFNFNTSGPIAFLVTFYLILLPLASVCLFLLCRKEAKQKESTSSELTVI